MKILTTLLTMQNQLKIFHWQTRSYAQHMAFGATHDALLETIDEFVEVYQGKYGLIEAKSQFVIKLDNLNMMDPAQCAVECLNNLEEIRKELDPEIDSDLLNISDEMKASLNKLRYLLKLK